MRRVRRVPPARARDGEGYLTWADYPGGRCHAPTTGVAQVSEKSPRHAGRAQGVQPHVATKQVKQLDRVIIRFAGDSGDGMQLTGDRFTQESAAFGNDLSTLPNFPAEIRAPQGTLPGVSSFQVHFADHDILTPGDAPDVLVAMNPAALRANLGDLPPGATIIVDTHDFSARNLTKAGYTDQPARRRLAGDVRRAPARPDRHDGRGGQGVRPVPQGRRAAPRTCSPSACCRGCTAGRPRRRSPSSRSGSPRSPTSATPTSRPTAPAGTSARPPRRSS